MQRVDGRCWSRRRFVHSAGAAGLGLLTGCGRQPSPGGHAPRVYRLGYLDPGTRNRERNTGEEALRRGLSDLGYVEGQNLIFEARYAEQDVDRLLPLAAELVQLPVDILVAAASAAPLAAKRATTVIPIIMGSASDPVGLGLVASLAAPGGNVTGIANLLPQLSGKRLEMLKEILPHVSRVAVLWTAANPGTARSFTETQAAAESLGLHSVSLQAEFPAPDFDGLFALARDQRADALVVEQDPILGGGHAKQIVQFAAVNGLPAVYSGRQYTDIGGLMAYGPSVAGMWYRAAYYVDRILKGAKPADLPVEQPREFEFVINLRTAQALGLTIPQHVLLQATEVIQ
jgi:putative tryptophan/tyrosine transport system substrate-binding protein